VRRMIRVGNSGGLQPSLALGDLVITTGAVRDDGTSRSYVLPEYPGVADWSVVAALVGAARVLARSADAPDRDRARRLAERCLDEHPATSWAQAASELLANSAVERQ